MASASGYIVTRATAPSRKPRTEVVRSTAGCHSAAGDLLQRPPRGPGHVAVGTGQQIDQLGDRARLVRCGPALRKPCAGRADRRR